MNPYLKKVEPLEHYCLMLWFENEEQKIFDLKPYLNKGIFSQLKNTDLFTAAKVVSGSIEWPNGLGLSYDTLYLESVTTVEYDYSNFTKRDEKNLCYNDIEKT